MRKLATFLHIIDAISEWTGKIVSFAVVLLIGGVVSWVLPRYLFHVAGGWDYATVNKIFFVYVIFGAAYALRVKAHVNMDLLHDRLPIRARSVVDLFTFIFFSLFCIALLWMAVEMAADSAPGFHLSLKTFWPPSWPVTLLAPIGLFLLLLQGLSKFIRDLIIAITGKEAL